MKTKYSPCRECPFRRGSIPGWLGAASYEPKEFLTPHWEGEMLLPCHQEVEWEAEQLTEDAHTCYGLAVMMKNSCKLPRDREMADAVRSVEADRENFFSFPTEFIKHHSRA